MDFNFGNMNSKKKNKDREDNRESQDDEPEMMEM